MPRIEVLNTGILPEETAEVAAGALPGVYTSTEQLRLFSLPLLEDNFVILSRLPESVGSVTRLLLKDLDGQLTDGISAIDPENRVMLNTLYSRLGLDVGSAIPEEYEEGDKYELVLTIHSPNGIAFTERYSKDGEWSSFYVLAQRCPVDTEFQIGL